MPPEPVNNNGDQKQLMALVLSETSAIRAGLSDLKIEFKGLATEMKSDRAAVVVGSTERKDIKKKQDELEIDLLSMKNRLTNLEKGFGTTNKILSWIAVMIGTAIFGLMWAVFTGQVTLVFS